MTVKQPGKTHLHSAEELSRAFRAAGEGEKLDLFVYGTLLNDNYVQLLLNRKVKAVPAELHHYMRVAPSWSFPLIVKHHGAVTQGRILKEITREELRIIDEFEDEGRLYNRQRIVARTGDLRQRCWTYVGNIRNLQQSFGKQVQFEDRFSLFLEQRVDQLLSKMPTDRPDIERRVLNELMGSAVDNIIQSHFDGNYICNYIMIQALEESRPPSLRKVLEKEELLPYAGNYMRLACQHIVFNQIVDAVRHQFPDSVRISRQYYRHGIAIMLGFIFYNRMRTEIDRKFEEQQLGQISRERSYRDYARLAIDIFDQIYDPAIIESFIPEIARNWYSTPTPLGAELEFSDLGQRAVYAEPGEDPRYDGFYWFRDFDLFRRTWRLGGHVDSHRQISVGQKRHRGFLEYAFGRFQIIGDLSLPLFDCPWAMSRLINEAVKFLDVKPHSLHLSMELSGNHSHITDRPHREEDLVCLLLLGGDLRIDKEGKLREWRIFNNELDTNFQDSIHFSDRKIHFSREEQEHDEAAEVMEYKFMRLAKTEYDYESLIVALKGYQLHTDTRPVNIRTQGKEPLPEHRFLREWGANPQALGQSDISNFIAKVEAGLFEELHCSQLPDCKQNILRKIELQLRERNRYVSEYC